MKIHSPWLILLMVAPSISILGGPSVSHAFADQSESGESAAPLSVAPLDHIEYPDSRPEWVEQTVDVDDQTLSVVVVSGPSDTLDESLEELKLMQRTAVDAWIARVTGYPEFDSVAALSDEEIDRNLVTRRYEGELMQGDSTKYEHAVELRFGPDLRESMLNAKTNVEVRSRLGALGVLTFGGLITLIGSSAMLGFALRRSTRKSAAHS